MKPMAAKKDCSSPKRKNMEPDPLSNFTFEFYYDEETDKYIEDFERKKVELLSDRLDELSEAELRALYNVIEEIRNKT